MLKNNLVIENAKIGFRNFSGRESKFNLIGRKNFCIFFDVDFGDKLLKDGWNIKILDKNPELDPVAYMQVLINYNKKPPQIYLVTKHGKTLLDEDSVSMLDWAELENVDVVITPYMWEINGKKGIKGYLKTMYVTIVEDDFADKYSEVPLR